MSTALKIKTVILGIQASSFIVAFFGACARWEDGWFCFNGIPALLSIILVVPNLLIQPKE